MSSTGEEQLLREEPGVQSAASSGRPLSAIQHPDERQHAALLNEAARSILDASDLQSALQATVDAARAIARARLSKAKIRMADGDTVMALRPESSATAPDLTDLCLADGGLCDQLSDGPRSSVRYTSAELQAKPNWPTPTNGLLAAVLTDEDMSPAGVLLVADRTAGDFTTEDEAALCQLATVASMHLRNIKARDAVARSEARYRLVAELMPYGMWLADADGMSYYISQNMLDLTGMTAEQWDGLGYTAAIHPDDLPRMKQAWQEGTAAGQPWSIEFRVRRTDGAWHWILGRAVPQLDDEGKLTGYIGVNIDIQQIKDTQSQVEELLRQVEQHRDQLEQLVLARTHQLQEANILLKMEVAQRQDAEAELLAYQQRLRSLAAELTFAEERQRRLIAAAVHDSVGQALAFTLMRLKMVMQDANDRQRENLQQMEQMLQKAIAEARSLTLQLSPPILYSIGLSAALKWLSEQTTELHGLLVHFTADDPLPPLSDEARIVLFQSARELLNNIVKHAQAHNAYMHVGLQDGDLFVRVSDDGVGFNPDSLARVATFGLFSVRERLAHLGGRLEIKSRPGQGSTLTVFLPLKSIQPPPTA